MAQDQRFPTPFTRRRFLQYTGSMAVGGGLLAACAGGSNAANPGPTNNSLPALQQWYHQYGETGTHEAVLKYAKNYTKANVNVSWVPGTGDEYPNKVRTSLLGTGAPDVFELPGPTVDLVKAGVLEPLDDVLADVKSDFNPVSLKPLTIGGKIYGIKMINDFTFVYYRKSMFTKAGVQPPTTMDELIAVCKKLAAGGNKSLYIGSDGGVAALNNILVWASGGDLISDDNSKVVFSNDRVGAMYDKLKELNATGGVLPDAPTYWWDPSAFTQGLAAMQFCGFWAMPGITKALGDDWGIFPWPALDAQSKPATNFGGWAEMVWAKGKNVDAAKQYVKYLWIDNSDVQIDWNVGYGFHVPPRASTVAKADKLKTGAPADAVQLLNNYGHALSPYWDSTMQTALDTALSNVLKSSAKPASELSTAADKASAELQKLQ